MKKHRPRIPQGGQETLEIGNYRSCKLKSKKGKGIKFCYCGTQRIIIIGDLTCEQFTLRDLHGSLDKEVRLNSLGCLYRP